MIDVAVIILIILMGLFALFLIGVAIFLSDGFTKRMILNGWFPRGTKFKVRIHDGYSFKWINAYLDKVEGDLVSFFELNDRNSRYYLSMPHHIDNYGKSFKIAY